MPAKKNQKAKKAAPKKSTTAKKTVASKKKTAKATTTKKAVKETVAKKSPVKKVVKKAPTKTTKKTAVKKPAKKTTIKKTTTKKKETKKVVKKITPKKETKKSVKKVTPKKEKQPKAPKPEKKESLAKKILAKHSQRAGNRDKEQEEELVNQAPIIVRRYESKNKVSFKVGDYAVYPSHGVGKIVNIEKNKILEQEFKCYLMHFEKERLTIKIPMTSADKIGIRPLISKKEMDEVFTILRSGIKKLKGMWSRRAQEYETKINSGDIMLLAEVLRDLTRDIEDSERSYSERIIYETAIYRLASEYSVIYGIDFEEAKDKIILIAKDKLGSEPRITQKDEFDEFDDFDKTSSDDEEDEEDEDGDEDEDDDDY